MDVIGSFMTRDVFVAAPSVLTSESTESVTFVDESERFARGSDRSRCRPSHVTHLRATECAR